MPGMERRVCVCVCVFCKCGFVKISSREKVQIPDSENFRNLGRRNSVLLS
jgi:hypothetical protein